MQTLPELRSSSNASSIDAVATAPQRRRASAGGGRLSWFALGLLVLFALLSIGTARAAEPAVGAGTLMLHKDGGAIEAPRVATDVEMTVNGLIARVRLRQSFRNDGTTWVEGVYLFPLPDTAAVDRLHLRVGERVIVGEIQRKAQAKKTYAKAKASGKKASLIQQKRANLFTNSVANIGPGETVVVEIEYQQNVEYDQGTFRLRFPMAVTPRYTPGAQEADAIARAVAAHGDGGGATPLPAPGESPDAGAPRCTGDACARAAVRVALTPGFALEWVRSTYHEVDQMLVGDQHQVSLRGGDTVMDRDFELAWRPASGSEPSAAVFTENVEGETYALLMLVPPHQPSGPAQPRELVLIIDRSGSMGGSSIRQARAALRSALDRLGPRDRFNVIAFDNEAVELFPAPEYADALALETARRFVDSLQAGGGTNMHHALNLALDATAGARAKTDGYLRQIVFVTDGAVGNEEQLFGMIHNRLGDARLFTVGIGSAPNRYFMRRAARFGRGSFTEVGRIEETQEKMLGLLTKLENPALTDVDVAWSVPVLGPEHPVGDLYLGEPVLTTVRLAAAPRTVTVRGAGGWSRSLPARAQDAPGVGALWARERIATLMDERVIARDRAALEEEMTQIALRHHLVSAFTSLVAVDKTPSRLVGTSAEMRKVAGVLPAGMTSGFPRGATSWRFLVMLGAVLLLLPFLLHYGWRDA